MNITIEECPILVQNIEHSITAKLGTRSPGTWKKNLNSVHLL